MKAIESVDFAALKEVAKELNDLAVVEKLKIIGTAKEALVNSFIAGVEAADAAGVAEKLSEKIVNFYNDLISDEAAPAAGEAAAAATGKAPKGPKPGKESKPPKEPKPQKEPKPPKEKKASTIAKGVFGSVIGSASNAMDELLAAGATVAELVAKAGVSTSRATNHIKYQAAHGVTFTETKVKEGEAEVIKYTGVKAAPAAPAAQ